jgi:3-hydroxyanthranilate 3,4-dioxygenase
VSGLLEAFSLFEWIDAHRAELKPPVGNKVIWPGRDYIVMAVGGPNARTDFHVNEGEEFFYQIEGTMHLRLLDPEKKFRDLPIGPGQIFLLPPRTPHSPQRPAGSVGLVIESKRRPEQRDRLQWYCENCASLLYEEIFALVDIEKQFQGVFERYYSSSHTECKHCSHQNGRSWTKPVGER